MEHGGPQHPAGLLIGVSSEILAINFWTCEAEYIKKKIVAV